VLDKPDIPAEPVPATEPGAWLAHIREIHPFWAARGRDADYALEDEVERERLAKQWENEPHEPY